MKVDKIIKMAYVETTGGHSYEHKSTYTSELYRTEAEEIDFNQETGFVDVKYKVYTCPGTIIKQIILGPQVISFMKPLSEDKK